MNFSRPLPRSRCRGLLSGLLLWLLHAGASAAPQLLSESMDNVALWPAMERREAPAATTEPPQTGFQPVRQGENALGLSQPYWVRISVHNPHSRPITWRLHHQNAHVVGFEPILTGGGELRHLPFRSPLYEITTPAGASQQIYVRRWAPERLVFRADEWRAWSPALFEADAVRDAYLKGGIYGTMLALALYNLFLFLFLRQRAYGYYVLYVLCFLLTWLSWDGLLRGPFQPAPLPRFLEPAVFAALGSMAAVQFTRRFLGTRHRLPGTDRLLRALLPLLGLAALVAATLPWGPPLASVLAVTTAAMPLAAWMAWRRGLQPARFLLLSSSLFCLGVTALVLMHTAGMTVTGLPLQLVPALQAAELLLMSFALADRLKALQREKDAMAIDHHQAQERSRQELEHKVRERTAELEAAKSQAEILARVDSLTGVANRRSLLELGEAEIQRSRRYGRPCAVIMIDLDHFKSINDSYGHAGGDRVLVAFAALVREQLRSADLLGRLGGEEFAVILPESDLIAATAFAERLRQQVAQTAIVLDGAELRLTVSLGLAVLSDDDARLDTLLRRADAALYQAKKAGRNQVAPPLET